MSRINSEQNELHCNIIVKGLVQGVSFRAFTKRKAQSLGLMGIVRNLSNGDVEIDVEGNQERISELIQWLRKEGSPGSEVTDVIITTIKEEANYSYFKISW
ncbi:MAG: acylphosphatase [Candidatus Thorarchaeota archaeon]